ncbi:hypothetical protein CFP56_026536 [Quercus suber]|uniref:Uncharacterized protein n=1 Tax=Quercus suber TaxID=58331 RepID=A0AAW0K0R7_QUESU
MQKQHHRTPYFMKEPASQTNSEAKFLGPARSLGFLNLDRTGRSDQKGLSYRLQTSLRHIRNRRRACCSASTLAFNSETFGPLATFGALGSSVREADLGDFFAVPSDKTDRAASIKRSKNKDLSSADGSLTW